MESRKYRTNWRGGPLIATIGFCLLLLVAMSSANVKIQDPAIITICFIFLLISINGFLGTFILIDPLGVYKVDYFFYKNGLKFSQIEGVYYHPTWTVGDRARTLSAVGSVNGKKKSIKLATNHFYSLRTIASVITEIKKLKPGIDLDEPAQKLMNSTKNEKTGDRHN